MNSFSGIVSFPIYQMNHPALISHRQKDSFVQVMVERVVKDPACIAECMIKLFEEEQAASYFSDFVEGMCKELNDHPSVLSSHLEACVSHANMPIVCDVFMHHPHAFGHLLLALDQVGRKHLIQQLIQIIKPSEWMQAFEGMLESIKREDGVNDVQNRERFAILLEMLNRKQTRGLIRSCAVKLPLDCYAILLAALNSHWARNALNKFVECHPLESFGRDYQVLIETLSQELPYDLTMKSVFGHILDLYRDQNLLVNHFKPLSAKGRINMLSVMSYDQRKEMLAQEGNNIGLFCSWLDQLYTRIEDYEGRKGLFLLFYNRILKKKKNEFLQTLQVIDSQALLFMLVCLEPKVVEDFLLDCNAIDRTRLFSSFKVDSTMRQLLDEINYVEEVDRMDDGEEGDAQERIKIFLYSVMALDMTTDLLDVDGGISVENCREYLQYMANSSDDLEANYIAFITKMPPFLIAIACHDSTYREIFLKLARHLTDEQLKFLVLSIEANETYHVIQPLIEKLRTDQMKTILEAFSEEQLVDFTDKKVDVLQETCTEYKQRLQQLLVDLEKCIQGAVMIPLSTYEDYQERTRKLISLGRTGFNLPVYRLMRHLETLGDRYPYPDTLVILRQIIGEYETRKKLLEGRAALILDRLEAVEKLISPDERQEEYDPFTSIYEGFWSSLPVKNMEAVGIFPNSPTGVENLGQLQQIGIKTDADLNYLLISKERQVFIKQLSRKMRGLFTSMAQEKAIASMSSSEHENQKLYGQLTAQWESGWDKFFNPVFSIEEAQPFLQELLQFLDFSLCEKGKIKIFFTEMCAELSSLDYLPFKQKSFLQQSLEKLNFPTDLVNVYRSLSSIGLKLIRKREVIFCLQYYLKQGKELKEAWERFREFDCYTIEDLFNKKIVTARYQTMQLYEVAKNLK